MAAIIWISLILFHMFLPLSTTQATETNITLNSSLSPTTNRTHWPSPSGLFAFGFYRQGNGFAVGVWLIEPSNTTVIIWTANRDNPPVPDDASLILSPDGRLLLRSRGLEILISGASQTQPAYYAAMHDSGNFALYDSNDQIIWGTFLSPTDTIVAGQPLLAGSELFAGESETNHSTGRFRLKMQNDGNLVLYPFETLDTAAHSYWSTGTPTAGNGVTLNLDNNGFMFLLNSTGHYIKNLTEGPNAHNETRITSETTAIVYRATLDVDGMFRLYSHHFEKNGSATVSIKWFEPSVKCAVKGICGFNSYCYFLTAEAQDCGCPHGFTFINPNRRQQGCVRNFIQERCGSATANMAYDIVTMSNTVFSDNHYSMSPRMSIDGCREACLQDCECEAAFFIDGFCMKHKLPLRYVTGTTRNVTVLIKFGTKSSTPDGVSSPPIREGRSKRELRQEILIISAALVTCSFVLLAIGFLISKHLILRTKLIGSRSNGPAEFAPRPFTYEELERATDGFKEELGKGAFGTVYRGELSNGGRIVAVKRLDRVLEEGEREFQREMEAIGRTHHRNLVRLLGFCVEGPHRLLVYEYMSNGSLADLLFSPERHPSWSEKMRIAMDIARGILYLHEECDAPIIHCDIKPQNILMDDSYCAKISDFGLAKLMKPDQTRTYTGIRGTRGYVAPEWHRNMPVTVKADVYSFGVMLLEIICCRRNVELEEKEEEKVLCYWAYDCFEAGELDKLVDCEEGEKSRMEGMVKVGLWCIQDRPLLRPSMKNVVLMLEGTVEIPTPPPPTSFLDDSIQEP